MDDAEGVTIENGVVCIDHPGIEAKMHKLAERWNVAPELALEKALEIALRDAEANSAIQREA